MRVRIGKSRVRFTVTLWQKWLSRLDEDEERPMTLRAGIQEMRSRLASVHEASHKREI